MDNIDIVENLAKIYKEDFWDKLKSHDKENIELIRIILEKWLINYTPFSTLKSLISLHLQQRTRYVPTLLKKKPELNWLTQLSSSV